MGDAADLFASKLDQVLQARGYAPSKGLRRLHGGAMMESWRFESGKGAYVLRRAPSAEMMAEHPFGHDVEAEIIRQAVANGVRAPEVMLELQPDDGLGTGYVMRALPGTADPRTILACDDPSGVLRECAGELAKIHAIPRSAVPAGVPQRSYSEMIEDLSVQFDATGRDRPTIALGLRWLRDNMPAPVEPVLTHGDFRMGNLLVEGSTLTGVLDWEMAHLGDRHEDLAYACMAVWRFGRVERPALGLGSLDDWIASYESAGGAPVDRSRLHFWLVYRTVWWALGCLGMAQTWRSGADRSLERLVISRRASEQELDLLLLLEDEAPQERRARQKWWPIDTPDREKGDATVEELMTAVSEWLGTLKDQLPGHDRFQLAVARNALKIAMRNDAFLPDLHRNARLTEAILAGEQSLATPGVLGRLRQAALEKISVDSPKYPNLSVAIEKWTIPGQEAN